MCERERSVLLTEDRVFFEAVTAFERSRDILKVQGQNLALAVVYVLHSLDSGGNSNFNGLNFAGSPGSDFAIRAWGVSVNIRVED